MILPNAWYAAAWSNEVREGQLLGRTLLDEPVVMWRADGRAVALADRCSHRGVPLSLGRIVDGTLQCGYHGVCFDAAGACVKIPGQGVPQSALGVRAYPLTERHGFVWLWFGDPEFADPALVPDVHTADDPAWAATGERIVVNAGHELVIENLNNHAHVEFVHPQIGSPGMADVDSRIQRIGDTVERQNWLLNCQAPPHFAKAGNFTGPVDRWFHTTFLPPSTVTLDVGCAVAGTGAPDGNRSTAIEFSQVHLLTPETKNTTHYFWVYARNFAIEDSALTAQIHATAQQTFQQDQAILEAQQRSVDRDTAAPVMNIAADGAAIIVSRIRQELATRALHEKAKALA